MLIAVVVFIVVTALIAGTFVALTSSAAKADRRIGERLREVALPVTDASTDSATIVRQAIKSPLPAMDRLLTRSGVGGLFNGLIEQSGMKTTPAAVMVLSIVMGATLGVASTMFVRVPLINVAVVFIGASLPVLYLMQRRAARRRRFEEQFPEALDLLARALRAGHAFQSALGMIADEMPDPVGTEFKKTFEQQNFGLPLNEALNELAARTQLLDVRFFVTAVTIQRETGGNLSEILDNLAEVVRERFKLLRQVRVHTAHGRYHRLRAPRAAGSARHCALLHQS